MNRTESVGGLLELTRPVNLLITGMTVVVGGLLAGKGSEFSLFRLVIAGVSAALVAAGANAINDVADLSIDLVNRPDRPLPSGRVSLFTAKWWGGLLFAIGVGLGFALSVQLGTIAGLVALLLYLYDLKLKRMLVLGNLAVALCGGLAFVYGGLAVEKPEKAVVPAVFALLIHLGREIVKDIEDEPGDRIALASTLPIRFGANAAQRVAAGVLLILASLTPLPYSQGMYSLGYLWIVEIFCALPLVLISFQLAYGVRLAVIKRISRSLKLIMLTGLAALYVG